MSDNAGEFNKLFLLYEVFAMFPGKEFTHTELSRKTGIKGSTLTGLLEKLARYATIGTLSTRKHEYGEGDRRKRYYSMVFSNNPSFPLESQEALALAMVRDFAAAILPNSYNKIANSAVSKSISSLLLNLDNYPDITLPVAQSRYMGNVNYSKVENFEDIANSIVEAIKNKTVCELRYHHLKQEEPLSCNHEITPLILQIHHDSIYLLAWEVSSKGTPHAVGNEPVHFALHRIKEIVKTRRNHNLSLQKKDSFQYYGFPMHNPVKVRVHFIKGVDQYIKERLWSKEQHIEELEDGSIILTFYTQSVRETFSKIMSFGITATVLEPESLKERIREESAQMFERYSDAK